MLTLRSVQSRRDLKKFILLPWKIYKEDPAWVPPLIQERLQFLDRKKNPFFEHAEAELLLAEREGEPVGRISAHIDSLHNEIHKEKTGFFGFFESINDPEISSQLLNRAAEWLKGRGMTAIRGPFSFSINEELGVVVKGQEYPPFILMAHTAPYYAELLERWGLKKLKDFYCWRYDSRKPVPEAPLSVAEEVLKYPGLKIREINPKDLDRDVRIVIDVFNSAWSQNWGFVPLTEAEIKKTVKDLKPILEPSMILIAEVEGKPAGICLCLPNVNQLLGDLNGRLFPFGLFKLIYRLKFRRPEGFRLVLLGVKKEYRGSVLGGLSVLFYVKIHKRGKVLGLKECELSWTLEDNEKINAGIQFMGGEHYKTYRIYEKMI
jgi:hypothetical protein